MKKGVVARHHWVFFALSMLLFACFASMQAEHVNFDELLEKTSYAVLLKELIGLTDTIGLLQCRMPKDERRFVEDSILGKAVRVHDLFARTDLSALPEDEIDYLLYWIALAKNETLPELLTRHIMNLENFFCKTYLHNAEYIDGESS